MSGSFWEGRKVIVTGHTGFKGAWLALWLRSLGAVVTGLSLEPEDEKGAFVALGLGDKLQSHIVDIRDYEKVLRAFKETGAEFLFHLAAQAKVGEGWRDPGHTYDVNIVGTSRVLETVEQCPSIRAVLVVTSDKVYANTSGEPLRESDELGGRDPYSISKAAVEMVVRCWRTANPAIPIATARAGNVIGGGDVASGRLLPDIYRGLKNEGEVHLRHPEAVRPWQFVLEPLAGYLQLAERLMTKPDQCSPSFNFGPDESSAVSVEQIAERVFQMVGRGRWSRADEGRMIEAQTLRLNAGLAAEELNWHPRFSWEEALELTVEWWRAEEDELDLWKVASSQLALYQTLTRS